MFLQIPEGSSTVLGAFVTAFLGTMTLVGWIVRYILSYTLPQQNELFAKQIREERLHSMDALQKVLVQQGENSERDRAVATNMYQGLLAAIEAGNEMNKQASEAMLANQITLQHTGRTQEKLLKVLLQLIRSHGLPKPDSGRSK